MNAVAQTASPQPDKLGFFFCLAVALHAAIILGVGFTEELRQRSAPRLEITLAKFKSDPNPNADFLAQHDQQGSGTLEEKALITTDKQRPMRDTLHSSPETLTLAKQKQAADTQKLLSSNATAERKTSQKDKEKEQLTELIDGPADSTRLSREIASLQAKLDIQRQAYANRPRVRRLTSMSTSRSIDAEYLHHWRTEVETIGNNNYPDQAKRLGLEGSLRLMVALLPDGSIDKVEILQKSGHPLLDSAAIRIVRLAAPFAPFPPELRREVDVLEIIRTWRFEQSTLTSES
ncbi:energy transducer TonB [Litorivivens sp.]|uniref:energy transducer TonB n=2 Tax=Litorivivens sp. TaxID=2020868 RepID=UPI00356667BF